MNLFLDLAAIVIGFFSLMAWLVIVLDAFQKELWKGLLCLFVWVYTIYYAIFEFGEKGKWGIVALAFGGSTLVEFLLQLRR